LAERKRSTRKSASSKSSSSRSSSGRKSSTTRSRSTSSRSRSTSSSRKRSSSTRARSTSTRKRSTASAPPAEAAAEEQQEQQADPLAAQGYGEEDFSSRDYVIPGVDAQDPEPYKWHTGQKRDHGGEDAIEIIDLVKQFGRTRILNGVNLGLPDNMISMVLGPSGTGKSVLIKHIVGLLYPDAGDVLVHGESIPNMTDDELFEVRKKFGLLFQDGALFGSMNVYDNTAFPLRQHTDKSEDEIEEIVSRRLREVGLAEAVYKMPNELSGGMRKRAGFARALVLDPAIVMFDEPDSGLDPVRTALLCELIREVHDENGGCYLVISHDLGTARRIADFIAVLWKGRIVESGPSDELFNSRNEFVNQFLNADVKGPLAMD
jgi:phospholipid/cholesterol/gamma-HCH transport system ATP-binding protein